MLIILVMVLLWLGLGSLIYFIIRRQRITLSLPQVFIFFAAKIMAGAVYGYIFQRFYKGDDTWRLNEDAWLQYQRLLSSPRLFFSELFTAVPVPPGGKFYFQSNDYLQNLEYAITGKTVALFNFISQGNYYINMLLFNFVGFWGVFYLYKLLADKFALKDRQLAAAVLFLFPPATFWLSGLRTEGFLLLSTAIFLYHCNAWLQQKRPLSMFYSLLAFAFILLFRNGFALALLPAVLAWGLSLRLKKGVRKTFALTYFGLLALALLAGMAWSRLNVLLPIARRQEVFLSLEGNTRFNLTKLEPNLLSFVKVLPEALVNSFVRPLPWEARGLLQWFTAAENIVVLVFIALTVYLYRRRNLRRGNGAWIMMLLMAALANYLLIGYVVPFPGAIVRYKIIAELFIIAACLSAVPPSDYVAAFTRSRRYGRYR
ncbi:MAG TPA: hypothetical protein VL307_14245 [Chitinophagaceae bacterium]|nr:hypothetical protein [Chitinophagaceae bacterium]